MIRARKNRETEDLGRFVQSNVGGELILGDGVGPDFTLKINKVIADSELDRSIKSFYEMRGYQQPDSNELYFTKGHQRRTICLSIERPNIYVTICNPDA